MTYPLVSVVIPIWNVSQYVEKSIGSLFDQSYSKIEYIFINDNSPDDSITRIQKLLTQYPNRQHQVKIIHHEINTGLGTSRHDGQLQATGQFIINCDSDDWFAPSYIEDLVYKAISSNNDIVICDYYISYKHEQIRSTQRFEGDGISLVRNILLGKTQGFLWNKLIKRELFEAYNIYSIPNINMWEDILLICRICVHAKSVGYIPEALIYYNQTNINSYSTQRISQKSLQDIEFVVNYLDTFFRTSNIRSIDTNIISDFKLRAKTYFLINTKGSLRKEYNKRYPEICKRCFKKRLYPIYSNLVLIAAYFHMYCVIDIIWKSINSLKPLLNKLRKCQIEK